MGRPKQTCCKHGHPFTGSNLRIRYTKEGKRRRICVACVKANNLRMMIARGGVPGGKGGAKRKPYCWRGHKLSGPNLYISPKGQRVCRACRIENKRIARRRQGMKPKHKNVIGGMCCHGHRLTEDTSSPRASRNSRSSIQLMCVTCSREAYHRRKKEHGYREHLAMRQALHVYLRHRIVIDGDVDIYVADARDHGYNVTRFVHNEIHRIKVLRKDGGIEYAKLQYRAVKTALAENGYTPFGKVSVWPWPINIKNTSAHRRGSNRRKRATTK